MSTDPDAVHGANFGAHCHDEQSVEAEWTESAFVELSGQRAHEAREAEVRVHA